MFRVRLIHWKAAEAGERLSLLRRLGYLVEYEEPTPALLRRLKDDPPAAFVIDLSRLPSHGRDVALGLRQYKSTRRVPLVFAGGAPDKVSRTKESLPDAAYTSWGLIGEALERAIASPLDDPVVPRSNLDGYAGTPLVSKLGIKPGAAVALVGAPDRFEDALSDLPESAVLSREAGDKPHLILWFVRSRNDLEQGVKKMAALVGRDGLWIAWPKKASGVASNLTQNAVRRLGLDAGLVDFKVCSIDDTWSGLKFTRKK